PTHRSTHENRPLRAEGCKHALQVAHHCVLTVVAVACPLRIAMSARIECDCKITRGTKQPACAAPCVPSLTTAVQQEDGWTRRIAPCVARKLDAVCALPTVHRFGRTGKPCACDHLLRLPSAAKN